MVLVYIRHSDDSRRKQESSVQHRDDMSITRDGRKLARQMADKIIKKYGQPDIIYLSPFTRTKQTVKEMLQYVKSDPVIKIDKRLSRYFSSKEKKNPSCFTETFQHKIPIYESYNEFLGRVDLHLYEMWKKNYIHSEKVVWCITHALPFIQVSKVCKLKIPKSIPFMYYRKIRSHRIKYIENDYKKKTHRSKSVRKP